MARSRQSLLELLKTELEFVVSGGYRRSARSPWRPPYIFEESPSCPNFLIGHVPIVVKIAGSWNSFLRNLATSRCPVGLCSSLLTE